MCSEIEPGSGAILFQSGWTILCLDPDVKVILY